MASILIADRTDQIIRATADCYPASSCFFMTTWTPCGLLFRRKPRGLMRRSQAKLPRVLQGRTFRRLGGNKDL